MLKKSLLGIALAISSFAIALHGQASSADQPTGEKLDGPVAIQRALKASVLTAEGRPFHAVMDIGTAASVYSGRVELWWVDMDQYHLVIESPKFSRTKTANRGQSEESDKGDYYPRWLENFVLALMNPLPTAKNFQNGDITQITSNCLRRDDRPGGITDQLTWGVICFSGSEPKIAEVLTFNQSMQYSDWKGFGKKQIARTYQTSVMDYKPVVAHLTKLEELKQPDETMFIIASPPLAHAGVDTAFVSTLKAESLLESAPEIKWPTVREGKAEGYMIIYARTDRTGQVRETAKHNSDQPGLASFGMEQALKYKFKPLLVDGVAQQMEMPLVLHFVTKMGDPIPILNVADMKKQIASCDILSVPAARGGMPIQLRVSVDESGKVAGVEAYGIKDARSYVLGSQQLKKCRFLPYAVDGKTTYYKGDVEVRLPDR